MKRILRFAFILLILVVFVFWIRRDIHWSDLSRAFAEMPWWRFAAVGAATLVANTLQGLRFYFLYPGQISAPRHVGLVFAMHTGNTFLPFRAGEVIRPFYMRRWDPDAKLSSIVGWVITDRLIETAAFIPFAGLGLYVLSSEGVLVAHTGMWIAASIAITLGVLGIALKRSREWKSFVICALLGLGHWFFNLMAIYPLIGNMKVSMALLAGVSLASALPGLPGGIVNFEAAFVFIARHFGMEQSQALAYAVASHVMQIVVTTIVGAWVLWRWAWPLRSSVTLTPNESEEFSTHITHDALPSTAVTAPNIAT